MPRFSETSLARLLTCDARLQRVLNMAIEIVDFSVLEGHRDQAAQDKAFAEGKSKLKFPNGKHNANPSRAVDIIPFIATLPGKYDWNDLVAFGRLMGVVQACAHSCGIQLRFGCDWDGDFASRDESFLDAPHVELAGDL